MSVLEAYAHPKKGFYDYHIENGKTSFANMTIAKDAFT